MDYELEAELIRKGCRRSVESLRISRDSHIETPVTQKFDFTSMSLLRESKENNGVVKTVKDACNFLINRNKTAKESLEELEKIHIKRRKELKAQIECLKNQFQENKKHNESEMKSLSAQFEQSEAVK
jgi:hypothetical protein